MHRDLKPGNIFVTTEGRAKLLDFGLAEDVTGAPGVGSAITTVGGRPATDAGQILGTVGYMAPEQVRGQAVDARTDLFAFGAVLYEMRAPPLIGGVPVQHSRVLVGQRHWPARVDRTLQVQYRRPNGQTPRRCAVGFGRVG